LKAAINPRARSYFTKFLNKISDVTPRHEVVNPALEVEVEPISRDEGSGAVNEDRAKVLQRKTRKEIEVARDLILLLGKGESSQLFLIHIYCNYQIFKICSNFCQ